MANATNPIEGREVPQVDRLDLLQEQETQFRQELRAVEGQRNDLLYGAFVEQKREAVTSLEDLDRRKEQLRLKIAAVQAERANVIARLSEQELADLETRRHAAREAAGKLGAELPELESSIQRRLVEVGQDLIGLRNLCGEAQAVLIAAGETDAAKAYAFNGYRRSLSTLAVLCLGRMGKLNLNSSISPAAGKLWVERSAKAN